MIRIFLLLLPASMVLSASVPKQITLDQGQLSGAYLTRFGTERVAAYLGIPYALPPVLYSRFLAPDYTVLPSWTGVRNATSFAPDCEQSEPKKDEEDEEHLRIPLSQHDKLWKALLESQHGSRKKVYSEDCLYLNVYVPDDMQVESYPVMVWFHGGGFMRGSPNDLSPFQLVSKQKVIFVSVAYRLNIFGFFSTLTQHATGNYGMLDQVAALYWVKNNIAAFGGDPGNVCIFGHDAGAVSVGLHLVSPYSSGLFQKAIAMSGNVLSPEAVTTPEKELRTVDRIANIFSCIRKPDQLLECLRRMPDYILLQEAEILTEWKPIVDKGFSNVAFLADLPSQRFKNEHFTPVPILTGYTDMDDALQLSNDTDTEINRRKFHLIGSEEITHNQSCLTTLEDANSFIYEPIPPSTNKTALKKQLLEFYNDKVYGALTYQLAKHLSRYAPVFIYRFDSKPYSDIANDGIPDWVSVTHHFDLISAFGLPFDPPPNDIDRKWNDRDKEISEKVMKMWSDFAWSSVPIPSNSSLGVEWDAFTIVNPKFLIINRQNITMSSPGKINIRAFEFWTDCYPKVMVDVETIEKCCTEPPRTTSRATLTQLRDFSGVRATIYFFLFSYISILNTS